MPSDPWENPKSGAREMRAEKRPVDYNRIVGEKRVLFLGESHTNHAIREHICRYVKSFREAGITHYAIEAEEGITPLLDAINRGEGGVDFSAVDVGPTMVSGVRDPCYEDAIRAVVGEGIRVVAIDRKDKRGAEAREQHLAERLKEIIAENSRFRVAVLIGASHVDSFPVILGAVSLRERINRAGISEATVCFVGGDDAHPVFFRDAARRAGLAREEFMLDSGSYKNLGALLGTERVDFLIHLPQRTDRPQRCAVS